MNILITRKFSKDVEKELNQQQMKELAEILGNLTSCKSLSEMQDCKKLKGFKNAYRIKFKDFRIGFIWEDETVKLSRILNRKDIYKYFP